MKPKTFEYLGKLFTPTNKTYCWDEKLQKLEGQVNLSGYSYKEFYRIAKENGCGKEDVFIMDGEKVIPCSYFLFYFGSTPQKNIKPVQKNLKPIKLQ